MWYRCLFATVVSLSLVGIALVVNARRRAEIESRTADAQVVKSESDLQALSIGPIRSLRFTLFDEGIRPAEMRIKPGLVNLMIEDKTKALPHVTIQKVMADGGVVVVRMLKDARQSRTRNILPLVAGKYQLVDATRPEHMAVLVVEP